eukprot:TRINITY_DN9941_c0_g1_i2.p1 TRINITY_DN9941_c0_g1~~TRINITY_DN9941_c0_g1_i2.p1  ORF type:complete len:351 (+),score=41.24 TRINITY_DN9941_c0_g1_i2:81-1055(+)
MTNARLFAALMSLLSWSHADAQKTFALLTTLSSSSSPAYTAVINLATCELSEVTRAEIADTWFYGGELQNMELVAQAGMSDTGTAYVLSPIHWQNDMFVPATGLKLERGGNLTEWFPPISMKDYMASVVVDDSTTAVYTASVGLTDNSEAHRVGIWNWSTADVATSLFNSTKLHMESGEFFTAAFIESQQVLFISDGFSRMLRFDVTKREVTANWFLNQTCGLVYDPKTELLYTIGENFNLISVDPQTGASKVVGPTPFSNLPALVLDSANQVVYVGLGTSDSNAWVGIAGISLVHGKQVSTCTVNYDNGNALLQVLGDKLLAA